MFIFMLLITLAAIIIHLVLMKQRSAKKIVEVVLLYMIVILFGVGTLMAGLFHILNGPATAAKIGWPAGSPFQFEVGAADVAFGLICILCLFFRGNFWLAAILANSFFLFICMIGHVRDLLATGNVAAYNIGPNIILSDFITPIVIIVLYIVYSRMEKE